MILKKKDKNLSKLVKNNKYYYSIGFGDFINIGNTDLDGIEVSYIISPDGNVTISYIGQVMINDKTKEEAQAFINDFLETYYQESRLLLKLNNITALIFISLEQ